MKNLYLLAILSALTFLSCSPREELAMLERAESVMEEHPDSALAILRGMTRMPSRRLTAKHALLHSRALDKCWIELKTDSIISPAVEYYKKHGSVEERIMADHYLGKIRFNAGDYTGAMICQTRAKKLADKNHMLYWRAMTASAIGFIYNANYDYASELDAFDEAYGHWVEYGDSAHISNAVYSLATALHNNSFTYRADSLYAIVCGQGNYEAFLYRARNVLRRKNPDVENGLRYYDEAISHGQRLGLNDGYLYALALSFTGKQEKAAIMLRQLSAYPVNEHGYYSRYRIYRHEGRYEDAMLALAEYTDKSDSIVRVQLNQSVHKAQSDYNELTALFAEEEKKSVQIMMLAIGMILMLLLVIVIMRFRLRRMSLEAENTRMTILYEEALKMLEESRKSLDSNGSDDRQDRLNNLRISFAKMYKAQFVALSRILERQAQGFDDVEEASAEYAQRVHAILSEIKSPATGKSKFESMLDAELDGIMGKLRADYPDFKEDDFRFLSYLIVGFDATTRSVITGSSANNMRVAKSRLLKRIKENPTANIELYRAFLFPGK